MINIKAARASAESNGLSPGAAGIVLDTLEVVIAMRDAYALEAKQLRELMDQLRFERDRARDQAKRYAEASVGLLSDRAEENYKLRKEIRRLRGDYAVIPQPRPERAPVETDADIDAVMREIERLLEAGSSPGAIQDYLVSHYDLLRGEE